MIMNEQASLSEPAPACSAVSVSREFDALSAILPAGLRARAEDVLGAGDLATLTHLAKTGMGRNSIRALASDLNYLETWALAATGGPLPCPVLARARGDGAEIRGAPSL
jgi:hypothetical protein